MPGDGRVNTVLLVEDEFLLAAVLQRDLEAAGWQVSGPCYTLAAASEAAREGRYDLAIMDLNLRGELAYPAAEVLLERGVPVILLTGYDFIDVPERFRRVPRLIKPYDIGLLLCEAARLHASGKTAPSGSGGERAQQAMQVE